MGCCKKDTPAITSALVLWNSIREHNISGAVAEVGVFKGEFARILNLVFSSGLLYLFDTVQG